MSGHSKWHSIKHKKAREDARRGSLFTKLIKEITVAARTGGGHPEANARLRFAIQKAKEANMPQDNITRAIKKGTGELPGVSYEEVSYEGYGPNGVALMLEVTTDNKNRTVSDLRHLFHKYGGNLGESGCVSWMFAKKGLILVEKDKTSEDKLLDIALEAGAEDMDTTESGHEITATPEGFEAVRQAILEHGIEPASAEVTMVPQTTVELKGKQARQMLQLMEKLEDHEDVQNVYANFDIPEDVLAEM